MRRALALAARARGRTRPNPMVGAVLVRQGRVIAEDYHRKAGLPHAEALVLEKAAERARGATLYVTLEPCCHTAKRTPPCTRKIIESGVARVVVAMEDPNPQVSGRGLRQLREAGVEVETGVLEDEARRLNEAYATFMAEGRPFVILKTAMTLDGKIATAEGQSKWITGQKARALVHRLRSSVDAIITAVGTARADDPELTARTRGGVNPLRVLIDPRLETPPGSRLFKTPPETLLVTAAAPERTADLEAAGVRVLRCPGDVSLQWLMKELASRCVMSALLEGGSSLNARALEEGVVDKVMFFIAPKIMGGRGSYPAVGGKVSRPLEEAVRITRTSVRRLGDDFLIEGYVEKR